MDLERIQHEGTGRLRELESLVDDVHGAISRLMDACQGFQEFSRYVGFSVPRMPRIPGSEWDCAILERSALEIPEDTRKAILRGLLISIDWSRKLREWNFDQVRIPVTDEHGIVKEYVQLRGRYQGIIA